MRDIRLVVLDVAGTMVKDKRFIQRALARVLENFGIKVSEEEANSMMGPSIPVVIRQLLELRNKHSLKISESWVGEIHKRFIKEMVLFYGGSPEVKERIGVRETLESLKRENVKIALDTDLDRLIVQTIIQRFGWNKDELIDFIVTSNEVVNGRPFPDMIFKAMELGGVQRVEKVAKIASAPYDIRQGVNARCGLVVGVTTGAYSYDQLAKEKPTHLIEELFHFPDLLQPVQVIV